MPWVLDGNNLARGQGRERVRQAALALARAEKVRIVVFFDGAPPAGSPPLERLGPVEVRYVPDADAAILALVRGSGRGWCLASDDRALGRQAHDRGAQVVAATDFWAKVERALATCREPDDRAPEGEPVSGGTERLPDAPARIRRLPRAGRRW